MIANVGSSREESNTPSKTVIATPTVVDALPVGTDSGPDVLLDSPLPEVHRPFSRSPVGAVADLPNYSTSRVGRRSPVLVPHWRLAREGPFLAERSSSSLRCFGAGCLFWNTTYRPSDYALPSDEFGIPLHHPRLLEWIGVPESNGDGTREVATFFIAGSGYGCGYPAASGCLSHDIESGRSRSICPLAAGHGVEDSGTGA